MKRAFSANEIYHVLNRGVDKRKIFIDDGDYSRFLHDLFEFNDTEQVNNTAYCFRNRPNFNDIASRYIGVRERKPRKLLVDVLAFCLMPNHYHLLLKPNFDDGVTQFMKKLNIGYAKYFNEKYERSGALFQGRFKAKNVSSDEYLVHLSRYIHLNPLTGFIVDMDSLEEYQWSSYREYLNLASTNTVNTTEVLSFFKKPGEYSKFVLDQADHLKKLSKIEHLTID